MLQKRAEHGMKILTNFSITTVSIMTLVSPALFVVLRLVAVGTVGFEGCVDLDSPHDSA